MQNDTLQVTLLLENNQRFFSDVLQNNEHLFKRNIILQFIIVDAMSKLS